MSEIVWNGCYIHFVDIYLARNDPFDAIFLCFFVICFCVVFLCCFSLRELECVVLIDLIFYLLCVVCFLYGDCPFVFLLLCGGLILLYLCCCCAVFLVLLLCLCVSVAFVFLTTLGFEYFDGNYFVFRTSLQDPQNMEYFSTWKNLKYFIDVSQLGPAGRGMIFWRYHYSKDFFLSSELFAF